MFDNSKLWEKQHSMNDMVSFLAMLNKAHLETNGKELFENFDEVSTNLDGKIKDYLSAYMYNPKNDPDFMDRYER